MKKIKPVEQLEQIKFEQIDSILQILGLIETKGIFFQKDPSKITHRAIEEILDILGAPIEKDKLVFKIPDELKGKIYWEPTSRSTRFFVGEAK